MQPSGSRINLKLLMNQCIATPRTITIVMRPSPSITPPTTDAILQRLTQGSAVANLASPISPGCKLVVLDMEGAQVVALKLDEGSGSIHFPNPLPSSPRETVSLSTSMLIFSFSLSCFTPFLRTGAFLGGIHPPTSQHHGAINPTQNSTQVDDTGCCFPSPPFAVENSSLSTDTE